MYEKLHNIKGCICLEPVHFGIFEAQYFKTTQDADITL